MALEIDLDHSPGSQLTKDGVPAPLLQFGTDAIDTQSIMAEPSHLRIRFAQEHIDDMYLAKSLTRFGDRR